MSKKIDVTRAILDLDGKPLPWVEGKNPMLLKNVFVNALLAPQNEDATTTGETKLHRFLLAQEIHKSNGVVEFGNDDIESLKKMVNKVFTAIVVGQVFPILNSDSK